MKEGSSRYSRDQAEFDRAIGFIDAAYALALTLLVTTLVVDDPREAFSSLGALGDAVGGQVLAFAIAFAVIASYWLDHHRLIASFAAIDYTTIGALHDGFSVPAFLALAAAQVVLSRGQGWKWLTYSLLSATAFVVCFLLASSGFSQTASLVDVAGLFQRLAVTIGWAWMFALALRIRRT